MKCPECGGTTKNKVKKIKKPVTIGSPSSILEFTAIAIALLAFFYDPVKEYLIPALIAAFINPAIK